MDSFSTNLLFLPTSTYNSILWELFKQILNIISLFIFTKNLLILLCDNEI